MLNNKPQLHRGTPRRAVFDAGDAFAVKATGKQGVVLRKWRGVSLAASKYVWMYTVRWADGSEDVLESMEFSCLPVQGGVL